MALLTGEGADYEEVSVLIVDNSKYQVHSGCLLQTGIKGL